MNESHASTLKRFSSVFYQTPDDFGFGKTPFQAERIDTTDLKIISQNTLLFNKRAKTEEDYFEGNLCERCSQDHGRQETDIPSPMNPIEHTSQSSQTDGTKELIGNPNVGIII